MARQQQTVEDMAHALYDDPDLASAVVADVKAHGTEDAIIRGERVLPHPQDAQRWHDAQRGIAPQTDRERSDAAKIDQLQRRLEALETHITTPKE